jgi:hypothetical protein
LPNEGVIADNAKAFDAVPDTVGKTVTGVLKISDMVVCNRNEYSSSPYDCTMPLLAATTASITCGQAVDVLSDAKPFLLRIRVFFWLVPIE